MRRLADTLPKLDGLHLPAEDMTRAPEFETGAILKALNAPKVGGRRAHAPAPDEQPAADLVNRQAPVFLGRTSNAERTTPSDPPPRATSKPLSGLFGKAQAKHVAAATIPAFDRPPPRPQPDKVAEAVEAARKVAQAECETRVAAAQEEERKMARETLEAERIRWSQDIAMSLSTQLDTAIETIRASLSSSLATALGPVLNTAMTQRAVEQFSTRVDRIMGPSSSSPPLTIKGPQVLLEALRQARGGDTDGLRLVPSADPELTATVNETTLRTTIRAFAATLGTSTGHSHVKR